MTPDLQHLPVPSVWPSTTVRTLTQHRLLVLMLCIAALCRQTRADLPRAPAPALRIVNIYNFVRNSDYRVANSEDVLFDCTQHQLQLIKPTGLPVTWALQYDALINPKYQKLFKEQAGASDEIAAWWEIPRQLAEKAGLKWRGKHDWDSASNVGFSPGYSPDERRKLVDVYMADFKGIFGYFPKTVGSWYIDEVTLAYMAEKYGIVASCNCKDQVGTDGYTLHGGYWNQAYYPSKLNAYMPAQTRDGQIDIPIFRMLGSDAIYQYGSTRDMNTLEPVYPRAGGSADWVNTFMDNLIHQPCLAFGFTQAGQENSFGWDAMKNGLTMQIDLLSRQSKAGEIQVETLASAGQWFHGKYAVTPPTAVVAMNDFKHQDRKSVWYDSRYYRINFIWQNGSLYIRDLHLFDQAIVSPTHDAVLSKASLSYETLPVIDGALWSKKNDPAGMWPVSVSTTAETMALVPDAAPSIKESGPGELSITQQLKSGGTFNIVCSESRVTFTAIANQGKPLSWALDLSGGSRQASTVQKVTPESIGYSHDDNHYELQLAKDSGSCQQLPTGVVRITASDRGIIEFNLIDHHASN